ncbi:GNAT family N-acetyltransferase [Hwangdonia lutea]|uniref:GNAT family N-acetyltransferase n=1 Tax=Hwangdonia lutea TaxID=3075823 RepID=A0AA97ENM2_9FLAO|nr:GNAT family N-acetyltransferase [Hwangdonia sp. SCSIO 19198]WOD43375.1 GNAT family N-acetyltransferase [Hwangdonia sp. SCSIO 19198]
MDFKSKCFLIYDVPKFFNVNTTSSNKNLKVKKVKQYPGFLVQLGKHNDFNTYFKSTFSKSSVQKFRRYNRRLEHCFSITYKMYYGDIDKKEYDFVFSYFNTLLTKRFDDKQITNNNLNPKEWDFYYDVVYPLILEKKASLFVIYNDGVPITVRLNYFSEDIIFDAITVFDIDYSKFHIGKISIMKILEWAFENDFKVFDFTKGYFDYKVKWSDLKYDFEYHIYYDSKSIIATLTAHFLNSFFQLKQYLREKDFNTKLHKLLFFIKKNQSNNAVSYNIKPIIKSEEYKYEKTEEIDINKSKNSFLKKIVFDYLYTSSENLKHINLFKCNTAPNTYVLIGGKEPQVITCV